MPSRRGQSWVDRLTVVGAASVTAALYGAAIVLAALTPASSADEPLLYFGIGATGAMVDSARKRSIKIAAFLGGISASFVHSVLAADTSMIRFAGYIVEVSVVALGGAALVRYTRSRIPPNMVPRPRYVPSLLALLVACASALTSYALVFADTDASLTFWVASHSIGTVAAMGALHSNRRSWISSGNPSNNVRELTLAMFALAATILATFVLHTAWALAGAGICVLFAVRFGTKLAHPTSLGFIVAITLGAAQQWGTTTSQVDDFDIIGISGVVILVSTVGRLARGIDDSATAQQHSATQWRKLAERAGFDAFIEVNASHRVVLASDSIADFYGTQAPEMQGIRINQVFEGGDLLRIEALIDRVVSGQTVRHERQFTAANGKPMWMLCIIEPRATSTGEYGGFTMYILDITKTRRTIEDGVESRATYADVHEEERRRLAQRVHDGALQDLAAANLLIGAARLYADAHDNTEAVVALEPGDSLSAQLARIEALLVSGMRQLRVDAIGTPVIDLRDFDVIDSLRRTVAKFESMNSAKVHLGECDLNAAGPVLTRILYSIAQEAMVNAILHSRANIISVDMGQTSDGFSVTVTDDGVGFDPELLQEVGHLGLSAMTNLAHKAGGWISLSTRPGLGTTIEAWVPAETEAPLGTMLLPAHRTAESQTQAEQQDQLGSPSPQPQADSTKMSS